MIDERSMELIVGAVPWALGGYLLGSIPLAWLLTWVLTGSDLRTLGSGNVGVMNTALSVHRWAGLVVLLGEIAKGVVAVVVPWVMTSEPVFIGVAALGAFIGTRWPVWLRFHGGRGNTCAASSVVIIAPVAFVAVALIWFGVRWLGVSNFGATRVLVASLPPAVLVTTLSVWWAAVAVVYGLLFLTTHRPTTDDHMLINEQFPSLWAFLMSPPRHLRRREDDSERKAPVSGNGL